MDKTNAAPEICMRLFYLEANLRQKQIYRTLFKVAASLRDCSFRIPPDQGLLKCLPFHYLG